MENNIVSKIKSNEVKSAIQLLFEFVHASD